jgi:peroxiredoxin (alkyl hydroperoxide reductase subunit C)
MNGDGKAKQAAILPRLGEPAPEFEAQTTNGHIRLDDFRGSWLVFFSHPADFIPVCTSEFIGFAERFAEFKKRGVALMGLSIDSNYAHIAWVRNIEQNFGTKIEFPIVADLNKEVSMLYRMVMPGESNTATSRCVFVIDPDGVVRATICYPITTGRNVDEILRLVEALQTTDKYGVTTPANWRPGEQVILTPPHTVQGANERSNSSKDCKDWYFCKVHL